MERIGLYSQLTDFTTEHAGTAEWCIAERNGKRYFVKKFQSPVYPSKDIGLPEKMLNAGIAEFKDAMSAKQKLYSSLRDCDQSGVLVVPLEVINYQFHICTIADYVSGNVSPEQICKLSEWQRLVLMRTLTLALMNVHKAGVVHSDMKPDNVLITQDEEGRCVLRLIDFDGSFFEATPPEDSEEIVGDPAFFSPEAYLQSMEEDIRLDHRIDIFALGIIFHYFWCGKYPDKPADQSIGECLLRDGKVTCDESIPLVLRQLIQRMLAVKPEERLELKSVYDVLGIQLKQYPPTLVNLPKKEKKPEPNPPDPPVKQATITVNYRNMNGELLKYRTLKVPFGARKTIEAEEIKGYRVYGLKTKEIVVGHDGKVDSPITFSYTKDEPEPKKTGKGRKVFIAIILLAIIYWIIMYYLSMNAYNAGNYSDAAKYMEYTPFFSELCKTEYQDTQFRLQTANTVSLNAVNTNNYYAATARISHANDTAYFTFTPNETGYYSFYSTAGNSTDTYGILFDRNYNQLATDDDSSGNLQFLIRTNMNAGQTYILGAKYLNDQSTGSFQVIFKRDGEILSVGVSRSISINTADASRYFSFTPETSGYYTFYSTGSNDPKAVLYDAQWSQLSENDDSDGRNFSIRRYLSAGTQYYLAVKLFDSSATGSFSIRVDKK